MNILHASVVFLLLEFSKGSEEAAPVRDVFAGIAPDSLDRGYGFPIFQDCGGVIPVTTTAWTYLSYKENELLGTNERCVWSLLSDDGIGELKLTIKQDFSISGSASGLTAFFWDKTQLVPHLIPHNTTEIRFTSVPLLLVLTTWGGRSNGIKIDIYPYSKGVLSGVSTNRALHMETDEGALTFPERGDPNENTELVSVVVATEAKGRDVPDCKLVTIKDLQLQSESDAVYVYTIGSIMVPLLPRGRFTSNDTIKFPVNSYPTVIVFSFGKKGTPRKFTVAIEEFPTKNIAPLVK